MVVDALERAASDLTKRVWPGVRDALQLLLLGAWCAAWLLLALAGGLLSYPPLVAIGLGTPALSVGAFAFARARRRQRLRRAAETSLLAYAQLEQIPLGPELEATLGAFDLAYRRVRAASAGAGLPGVELEARVEASAARAREQLIALARRDAALARERAALGGLERTATVHAAAAALGAERRHVLEEAERVTAEAQTLADRVTQLGAVFGGSVPARTDAGAELLEDLERTQRAYQEIDGAEGDPRSPARDPRRQSGAAARGR